MNPVTRERQNVEAWIENRKEYAMRGGKPDRETVVREKKCLQCGTTWTHNRSDRSCVRCPQCRSFRNGDVPVTCDRCGIKLAINASLYYGRIKPVLDREGAYICPPCRHTLRERKRKAEIAGNKPTNATKEALQVPCGTIYKAREGDRCTGYQVVGGCEHYMDCVDTAIKHNWPGWECGI